MRSSFLPALLSAAVALGALPSSHAFQASRAPGALVSARRSHRERAGILAAAPITHHDDAADTSSSEGVTRRSPLERSLALSLAAAGILLGAAGSALGVSGGGLDYAGLDISGQDYSNGNYKGKDFTQVLAKATTFAKSNLQGCRFYKAYLVNANFEDADARGASFEDTSMDGANLRNINAAGSYFGQSLLDVATMEGGDFTDAQIPVKTLKLVCERDDVKGTNPTTGADTRDSLMCL